MKFSRFKTDIIVSSQFFSQNLHLAIDETVLFSENGRIAETKKEGTKAMKETRRAAEMK